MPARNCKNNLVKRAKILLVDRHPVCCEGMESILRRDESIVVCGHANDAASALSAVARLKPALVITDMDLPGKSGIELLRDLRTAHPELPVLVLSVQDESVYAEMVLRVGGRGCVSKQATPDRILKAVSTVLAGGIYASEQTAASLLDSISRPKPAKCASPLSRLTEREFEIFRLIGYGKDGHEIADALHMSIKTADTHRGRIKEKLCCKTSASLIHYATLWMAGMGG